MKTTHLVHLTGFAAAVLCGGFALPGHATPIAVTNPSFETDVIGTDGGTRLNATGWTTLTGNTLSGLGVPLDDTVSTFNPTAAQFAGAAGLAGVAPNMAGPQALLMTDSLVGLSGSITQTTGALLTLGQTYTLTVAVGNPGTGAFQGYALSILAGTNTLATTPLADEFNIASGTFTDKTLTFLAGPTVAGLVNLPVTIVLSAPTSVTAGAGVAFDNVRLDLSSVPEPSPLRAIAAGVGLLFLANLINSHRRSFGARFAVRSARTPFPGVNTANGI